jgi:hypothetical protein
MRAKYLILFLFGFALVGITKVPALFAEIDDPQSLALIQYDYVLKENYISLELVRNQPFSTSQQEFTGGDVSQFFGFKHTLRDQWLMGVSVGFKRLKTIEENKHVTLFTVSQESMYLFRVAQSTYFALGPKLLYLLPTKGKKIPPEKERDYRREIGAAVSFACYHQFYKRFLASIRVERWRGLNREVFQGVETAVGVSYSLP